MRTLELNLDGIRVESFSTTPERTAGDGTVFLQDSGVTYCGVYATCLGYNTCGYQITCQGGSCIQQTCTCTPSDKTCEWINTRAYTCNCGLTYTCTTRAGDGLSRWHGLLRRNELRVVLGSRLDLLRLHLLIRS
jgi:hypothetical protein